MSEFLRTALYFKNVPRAEQLARVLFGAALLAPVLIWALPSWAAALLIANAVFVAATGFVGFCPACYLVGRRLRARGPAEGAPPT